MTVKRKLRGPFPRLGRFFCVVDCGSSRSTCRSAASTSASSWSLPWQSPSRISSCPRRWKSFPEFLNDMLMLGKNTWIFHGINQLQYDAILIHINPTDISLTSYISNLGVWTWGFPLKSVFQTWKITLPINKNCILFHFLLRSWRGDLQNEVPFPSEVLWVKHCEWTTDPKKETRTCSNVHTTTY